ncbi:MAG: glyceraldehyde-3-phosphate dehydrogenase [Bacteroidetes bacterium]|nr:glyceraldehyde-3-phosphate dehydrogenase [Bacteroidota bacterium]
MPVPAKNGYESGLNDWIKQEKAAIELIGIIGNQWFEKSVELIIFHNELTDRSSSELMNLHLYAQNIVKQPITIHDTLLLAKEIQKLDLSPSRIDIGKLASEWILEKQKYSNDAAKFITDKLKTFIGKDKLVLSPKDVVLYGFGRIGRIAARELISQAGKGEQLRLRAIVTRNYSDADLIKRADLLRTDSVHGPFPGTVVEDFENKALIINGHSVKMLAASKFDELDYTAHGIQDALLIDNTGTARDREGLGKHLLAKGISKVLLTAPGKGDIPNIVFGVNHEKFDIKKEKIFSAASCTTNGIIPVLKVIEEALTIKNGHLETIHSYTNDQNLLDNYHKKSRRGRSAPLNMVITETGASSAVGKVIPSLKGKLTANSVRVPTPNVSLAILHLEVNKKTTKEEVNELIRKAALYSELVEQIQYSYSNELVSTDVIGNPCPSVYDSQATIVAEDGIHVVLYVWYDNEYGYTKQVFRLAKYLAEVIRLRYY